MKPYIPSSAVFDFGRLSLYVMAFAGLSAIGFLSLLAVLVYSLVITW